MLRLLLQRSINRWREGWATGFTTETLYRVYGVSLAALLPLFGVYIQAASPDVYEPLGIRWLFASAFLLITVLSYVPGFFKQHFVRLSEALGGLVLGWGAYLAYVNDLDSDHAFALLGMAITFILATGLASNHLRTPSLYVGILALLTLFAFPQMERPQVETHIFLMTLAASVSVAFLTIAWALHQRQALDRSHQRYKMFIQNSTEGIWRLELRTPISIDAPYEQQIEEFFREAYIAEANPTQARMYGFSSPDIFMGLPIDGMLPADDEDNRKFFHRIIANGYQLKDGESMEYTKDGEQRWFLNNITSEVIAGKVHRMWGIQRDITAQKTAEAERALTEQKLALHAERSPMGFIEWDLEDRALRWNKAAEAIFGYSADEMLGRNPAAYILPPELHEEISALSRQIIAHQQPKHNTNANITKDGRRIMCEWFNTPLVDANGKVLGMASLVYDVTERERITEALRQSEERYSALFHEANTAILLHDLDGHILDANRNAEHLFGYARSDFKTRNISRLHPTTRQDESKHLLAKLQQNTSLQFELDFQRQDGSVFPAEVSVQLVTLSGTLIAQALIRDLTEKRLWEERTLRAQRLESLGTLASGIAHDLNNMLNPVLMGIDVLRTQAQLTSANLDVLDNMEASAARGVHLVKQVLAFGKGIEGKRTTFQPADNIREIGNIIRQTFPRNITFKIEITEGILPIHADSTQFQQVLVNLCVNARDAMPEGGTLTIQAQTVDLSLADVRLYPDLEPGNYLKVDIIDDGIGMSAETQHKIFEPFFTTKPLDSGTGLGLSVALGIVRAHQGTVHVYSEVGVGTRISLFWPTAEEVTLSTQPPPTHKPAASMKGKTLLVVDDEPMLLELTQQALELEGFEVVTATNGREAWQHFKENPQRFDLLLTDMMMPDVDGPALIRDVHTLAPNLKIITSSGLDVSASLLEDLNTSYFLPKPYRIDQLLTLIQEVFTC